MLPISNLSTTTQSIVEGKSSKKYQIEINIKIIYVHFMIENYL